MYCCCFDDLCESREVKSFKHDMTHSQTLSSADLANSCEQLQYALRKTCRRLEWRCVERERERGLRCRLDLPGLRNLTCRSFRNADLNRGQFRPLFPACPWMAMWERHRQWRQCKFPRSETGATCARNGAKTSAARQQLWRSQMWYQVPKVLCQIASYHCIYTNPWCCTPSYHATS